MNITMARWKVTLHMKRRKENSGSRFVAMVTAVDLMLNLEIPNTRLKKDFIANKEGWIPEGQSNS